MKKSSKSVSNSKRADCIPVIRKIKEDIDTINLSDQTAWNGIAAELESLVQNFPKNISVPLKMLSLCLQGVQALAEATETRSFALVEAVSNGLNASENYLLGNPSKKSVIQKAELSLQEALPQEQGGQKEKPASEADQPESPLIACLDDAALFLIQLEPDDVSGLSVLRESLNRIVADRSHTESCRDYITQALKEMDEFIEVQVDNPEIALANVGELLDKAMNSNEKKNRRADAIQVGGSGINKECEVAAAALPSDSDAGQDEVMGAGTAEESFREMHGQPEADNSAHDYMPEDADPDLLSEFITESTDLITGAEEALLALETDPEDMDAVNTVFRAFHTIKGTAAFMDLMLISEMGHHAESLLSRVRDREIRYGGGYADLSLRALDMLNELILSVQGALKGNPLPKPQGYDDLMALLANPEAAGIADELEEASLPRVGDVLVAQGKVERDKVEQVAQCHPDEKLGAAMVKAKAASVTDVGQALRTQKRMKRAGQVVESSVRVTTQRLDRLIDMVGEIVIAHAMVAQDAVVVSGNHHELAKKVAHTSKIVRELQNISMSMRMVPLKATFNKMARLVRDLARKEGKSIDFITEGEDTEIDRNLVDIINDPLVHMVRNAVDHGIEMPEVRKSAGKSPNGTVQLCAYHSAGSVVVEIKDDGKGLDREVILAKAMERGLVSDGSTLSDREVFNLLFEPGFSTAETVTDVSGRGVGMDVVKKNIESLRGQAEIRSETGNGCVFKMSLPLTLAIIDGMAVRVGSETYVIPSVSIVRSIKLRPDEISTVHQQGEMISLQGKLIPLFRLATLYEIDDAEQDLEQGLVVVVVDEDRQAGLFIDELVGKQQVVIKTLGETMKNIPGITGGAIMPNGRIGLIIDVGGLVRFANAGHGEDSTDEFEAGKSTILAA